jgi:pimeloyl-ACP methyl ester carboxylesterase
MLEPLECRVLLASSSLSALAGTADASLSRADGSNLQIIGRRDTWIIIHGLGGSTDDVKRIATAVDAASTRDQVLLVDWSKLAEATDNQTAVSNTQRVADVLAQRIAQIGLPASRINLIAFSLGALIASRLAANLHASGGVNRIIALDPAAPKIGIKANGHSLRPAMNLSSDSQYSITFHAGDNRSFLGAALSSDDTVLLANMGATADEQHRNVLDLFGSICEANTSSSPDKVSSLFSLKRIASGKLPAWEKNAAFGYEATLGATIASNHRVAHSLQFTEALSGRTVNLP